MAKRRGEFAVGFPEETICLFGKRGSTEAFSAEDVLAEWRRDQKNGFNSEKIYRLVPVTLAEVKRQAARERKGKR